MVKQVYCLHTTLFKSILIKVDLHVFENYIIHYYYYIIHVFEKEKF